MTYPTLWRAGTPSVLSRVFHTNGDVDRLFDRFFNSTFDTAGAVFAPSVDVHETTDAVVVSAELPGIAPGDVEVNIENHVLTIAGEKKAEETSDAEGSNHRVFERRYGRFERRFTLPRTVNTEKVDARFADGVLTVTLPKAEEAKPRQIKVQIGRN